MIEHACMHRREESREEEGVSYIISRACKTGQDGFAKKEECAGSVGGCYRVHSTDAAPPQRVTQVILLNDHESAGCSKWIQTQEPCWFHAYFHTVS